MRFWGRNEAESFWRAETLKYEHYEQLWKEVVWLSCTWTEWHLESSQLVIVSVWRCWLVRFLSLVCISCISSSSTDLLFYSSNNLPVGEDPLHLTDERCSVEEDCCVKRCLRSWQGMVLDLLRWNSTWHDHPMFSFTPCRCSFSRRPATCFWQISKEVLVYTETTSQYGQKIFLQELFCPKKRYGFVR